MSLDAGEIQKLAYQLWERDGRPTGRDHDHWREAEEKLSRAVADPGPAAVSPVKRPRKPTGKPAAAEPKRPSRARTKAG